MESVNLQTSDELGGVAAQTDERRMVNALGLLASSRAPLMENFGVYLRASAALESWLAAGAPTDEATVKAISPSVIEALSSLTLLGTAALSIAGVSGRACGVEPDMATAN